MSQQSGREHEFDQTVIELDELLRHVSAVNRRTGKNILAEFDMTPPQHSALLQLHHHGNLTIGELSEKLHLAFSTATDLINRMERNGLVMRERDAADRRVVRLRILDKGERMLDEIIYARRVYFAELFQHLAVEERQQLIDSLRIIDEIMSADSSKS